MSVAVEKSEEPCEPPPVERARAPEQSEGREQVQRAQRDFHRAGPVRPVPDGILRAPALNLLEKFFGEALLARERVGASEREQVAEPVQLPQRARVRAVAARERHVAVVAKRPARARRGAAEPVNPRAETKRPEAAPPPAVRRDDPARLFNQPAGLLDRAAVLPRE